MDKIQATGNRNKVLTGGMIDVAQDGSVLQGVYAPAVLVRDEAERDALPADYPPGTIAFTPGEAQKWQKTQDGAWADYVGGSGSAQAAAQSAQAAEQSAQAAEQSAQDAAASASDAAQYTAAAVAAWLNAHPEATTTVQDGAITRAKLDADLQEKTDEVGELKSAIDEVYTGFVFSPEDFEKGGISRANVNDAYRQVCRCRLITQHIYPFDIEIKTIANHTAFNVFILDSNGTYVSDTGWKSVYTIPKNTKFRIMIEGLYQATADTLTVSDILAKISTSSVNLHDLQAQLNNIEESAIYINIKDYGAVGDGVTDDTQAIQDAFNAVKESGGTVYAPAGTYLVNTILFDSANNNGQPACLHIYSNTTLLMDKNAVLKKGHNVSRILMTHNESDATGYDGCENIVIDGGVFDGDNTLASPDTGMGLLYFSHGKFITLRNSKFINSVGSWHALECNSSRDVLIDNCEFNITGSNGAIDIDAAHNSGNLGQNDDAVCYNIEIRSCWFNTKWRPGVQNHTQFNHHNIRVHDNVFYMQGSDSTRGAVSFHTGTTKVDVYNNTFYNNEYNANAKAFEMISEDQTSLFHDNRVEGMGTPYVNCKAYNNMLNGVFTV